MSKRTAALADAFEAEDKIELDGLKDQGTDVYISFDSDRREYFDRACAIAYDHGFVPVGTITAAARFKPRDDYEVDV